MEFDVAVRPIRTRQPSSVQPIVQGVSDIPGLPDRFVTVTADMRSGRAFSRRESQGGIEWGATGIGGWAISWTSKRDRKADKRHERNGTTKSKQHGWSAEREGAEPGKRKRAPAVGRGR